MERGEFRVAVAFPPLFSFIFFGFFVKEPELAFPLRGRAEMDWRVDHRKRCKK